MKGRVKTYLNIRATPEILLNNNINNAFLRPGDVIEIAATIIGETYKGNNTWYRMMDGGYVWSGGMLSVGIEAAVILPAVVAAKPGQPIQFDAAKMSWGYTLPGGIDLIACWNQHNLRGQNVRVAVLDSGINTAIKDLMDAVENKLLDMKSFIAGETIDDDIGHGTNCASIIVSRGMNLFGAAPECKLIVAKIESKTTGKTPATTLAALKWVCEERGADIISLSFSFPSISEVPPSPEEKAIADYILKMHLEKNKLFVASIGNLGENAKPFNAFPANYPGCISIGAYGAERKIWSGSSWNKRLYFAVPGVDLKGYGLAQNPVLLPPATSYACPFAAGILANLLSHFKATPTTFSATEFISKLAFDTPPEDAPLQYGKGIINPIQSLKNLKG